MISGIHARKFIVISAILVVGLAAVALPLLTSYDLREWLADTFLVSEMYNARPVPPFEPPVIGPDTPVLRFIAVGDVGTGGSGQSRVAGSMSRIAAKDSLSFVLLLGDNIYEFGVSSVTDPQWQEKFESVYSQPSLQIPFYALLGNHDYHGNPQAQVGYTTVSPRWRMPARYYAESFSVDDSTGLRLFCLDTNPMEDLSPAEIAEGDDSLDYRPQLRWLEQELSASTERWKIVAGHHGVYSNGDHGNHPGLGSVLEPLFVRYGVDLYLAGHDHDLQMLEPVQGVSYIISGAGGKDRSVSWEKNTIFAATKLGFVRLTVSYSALDAEFFDGDGVLRYAHAIRKPAHPH